jgi:hypothetical protein
LIEPQGLLTYNAYHMSKMPLEKNGNGSWQHIS